MFALVQMKGVVHVYDGQRRRFVRKNAATVAQALGEPNGRTLRAMLAHAEWGRTGKRPDHYVALRMGEDLPRNKGDSRRRYPWAY